MTLAVAEGEVLALVGPNGAGKSTLLNLIAGDLCPSAGSIPLDGTPLAHVDLQTQARRSAVLRQRSAVSLPFTAFEVALMGRSPHLSGRAEEPADDALALTPSPRPSCSPTPSASSRPFPAASRPVSAWPACSPSRRRCCSTSRPPPSTYAISMPPFVSSAPWPPAVSLAATILVAGCGERPAPEPALPTLPAHAAFSAPTAIAAAPAAFVAPPAPQLPATVTNVTGEPVTVTSFARIVSLTGDITEIIFALGLGDRIVGVDSSATYPPGPTGALPNVGYQRRLSAEGILALTPTLVLRDEAAGPPEALAQLRAAGVPAVLAAVTLLVYRLAHRHGRTDVASLLLVGLALNALVGAGTGLLTYLADAAELRSIGFWTMGGLGGALWETLLAAAPGILLALLLAPRLGRALNLFALGEAEARHLGVATEGVKGGAVILAALATGAAVALTGPLGFVGLIVPHMVRLAAGPDHRLLLPASALGGATLLILADLLARTVAAPAEVPVGLLTAFAGGPVYLLLVLRARHQYGWG